MLNMFRVNKKKKKRKTKKHQNNVINVVLVLLWLTLAIFHTFFSVSIVEFEQVNVNWVSVHTYWNFITDKFKGVDFKYDNFFKLQSKACPNTTFLVPNFIFYFFKIPFFIFAHSIFACWQIQGVDFIYDHSFFKYQSKNTQIKHFRSLIWVFLVWQETLHFENSRVLISNMKIAYLQ